MNYLVTLLMMMTLAMSMPPLHKGVSLSNWFWNQNDQFDADTWITEQDYVWLKRQGYDHVRIPVDMADLDKSWVIPKLRQAIQWGINNQLIVIVSCFGDLYNNELVPQENYQAKLKQLAAVVAEFSVDQVLFQVANEPDVPNPKDWSRIQADMIRTAREVLPDRWLLTSTPLRWRIEDGWDQLKAFSLMTPSDDQKVIYTLYFYEPFFFTHQGATWSGDEVKHVKGYAYPVTSENADGVIRQLPAGMPEWLPDTLKEAWNTSALGDRFKVVTAWRDRYQRPVMVSEIGVHRPYAPKGSVERWFDDVKNLLDKNEVPYTIWDYRGNFSIRWDDDIFSVPKDEYR